MIRKAHIVWNKAKTEGVIFVDDDSISREDWPLTASDDAYQALTGESIQPGIGSALAEAFIDAYDDEVEDGKTSLQVVSYDFLIEAGEWPK